MPRTHRWILVFFTALTLVVGACAAQSSEPETASDEGLAQIDDIAGSDVKKITMSEEAVERIGVETVPVAAADGGRVQVPSATVLYDQAGRTWVFTEPEHDVFVRQEVTIIGTKGEDTILSTGPTADTPVVTVGVAELYGTELGVGDPE
jgi:hypothetical protein